MPLFSCEEPQPGTQAVQIANSLRNDPEDWAWRIKGYELEHVPSGFVLWVGNEDYGLAEVASGTGWKEKFSKSEQSVIWPAVQTWLAQFKTAFSLRPVKPRVWMAASHWYCRSEQHPWTGVGLSPEAAYRSWVRAVSVRARKETHPNDYLHVWSAAV